MDDLKIPSSDHRRIVVVGGGFAGLKLVKKLRNKAYQVVLLDKHNYHQFQPLIYQVATAGIESSAVSFPFRKIFQKAKNVYFRHTEVLSFDSTAKLLYTSHGALRYDKLVIATGTIPNFFGNQQIKDNSLVLKSLPDSLFMRNQLLKNIELCETSPSESERKSLLSVVIAGGGPTGVEVAGTLAEMKKRILPKDYPDMKFEEMQIYLVENADRLLNTFSTKSSAKAKQYLEQLGVQVLLEKKVISYDGNEVTVEGHENIATRNFLWTAGVCGRPPLGFDNSSIGRGVRLRVNRYNEVEGYQEIYAIGDIALISGDSKYPNGHPQLAQVAIQQADNLRKNLKRASKGRVLKPFEYKDLGIMATVGRNLAVVELPFIKLYGITAWFIWMFVHLMAILGVKNKLIVLINWVYYYFTFDQSLRMIVKQERELG